MEQVGGSGGPNMVPQRALDGVITEAKKRFKWCAEWEGNFRPRFVEDVKFANGDPDNHYQWPEDIRNTRQDSRRPCLTMNLIRQHNLNISNEARKNKSSVKVVGTGNGATEESASAFRDVMRHIETISKAQDAYTIARGWQIDGGIGFWRLITDYAAPDSFDQEIYIRPVIDPLSVYLDPDIIQKDGSDSKFGFVFDNVPREEFNDAYPELTEVLVGTSPLGVGISDADWINRNFIRVCEYFRKVRKPDRLISFMDKGERKTILESKLPRNAVDGVLDAPQTKVRNTHTEVIEWYLIAGDIIVDQTIWPGKYIPLVRCIGEEVVIDGLLDRKGHTRNQKDAQRMYNYNASAQVEFVALQGKTPWIAAVQAIEGLETMWNSANVTNHSVLIYNAYDDDGNAIPPPQRTTPPTASPAYQTGMETAFNQIMMVSGQYQNQLGMMGNERTGAAIDARTAQSATSVFHYQDNYEVSLRFTATILLDLIPIIYNTKRVIAILAEDGETFNLEIDPQAKQAFMQQQAANGEIVRRIFNPRVGMYDVAPSVGPEYGAKRTETRDALSIIITQAKELTPILGDLLMASMDFEGAQEAARRMKRMVPPQALGTGPTANETKLGQQIQGLTQALTESLQRQAKLELKLVGKDQMRDIDVVEAQTKRLGALVDFLPADSELLKKVVQDALIDALRADLYPVVQANANNIDVDGSPSATAPVIGASPDSGASPMPRAAKQAADGNWYLPDPQRDGKYLRVEAKNA